MVAKLKEVYRSTSVVRPVAASAVCMGQDPALDQFMEAYCEMLSKYEELTKPIKEIMLFLSRIETQFHALTLSGSDLPPLFLSLFFIVVTYMLYILNKSMIICS